MADSGRFLALLLLFALTALSSGIRREAGAMGQRCRNTVHGRFLLADDAGYVCNALSVDPLSRCCPDSGKRFSCQGCHLISECCDSYEFCVSCCLNPIKTVKEVAMKVKIAKPVTAGTYASVFDFCVGRCRHNSASVVHENAYASAFHHCFSMHSNSSGVNHILSDPRLNGISIIIGRQGESCRTACSSKGQSCVFSKLSVLNKCEFLQKHMNCKGTCLPSVGADQPAQVAEDAPHDLNPGSCLFTQSEGFANKEEGWFGVIVVMACKNVGVIIFHMVLRHPIQLGRLLVICIVVLTIHLIRNFNSHFNWHVWGRLVVSRVNF